MNTQKLEIAIKQLERVHRDMNDCANRFILKDAIDQLQKQVKLFAIPDVVVQKGTLICTSCDGTGGRVIYDTYLKCKECNGSGAK